MRSKTRAVRASLCVAVILGLIGPARAQTTPKTAAATSQAQQKRPPAQPTNPSARPAQATSPTPQAVPQAQPSQAANAQAILQLKPEPAQPDWTKVCGKPASTAPEVCYTTRDFVSEQGQSTLALAVYEVRSAQPVKLVRVLMPLGLLLQPGIRLAVDQRPVVPGRFGLCVPSGCFAEAPVNDEFVSALKSGTSLKVSAQNQAGREVSFAVPVAGFSKAFDGAPINPELLAAQQKKLQAELERRTDELRKRLEQQGQVVGSSAAAAR
jgi:invasion protein IalB